MTFGSDWEQVPKMNIFSFSGAQQPFRIAFKSDAFEYTAAGAIADPASHGFKLRYWQMTC